MEICRQAEIPFVEQEITEADLKAADEVFIAGTGSEVTPAVNIDGKIIGDGLPGKLTRTIQRRFFDMVNGPGQ
jgi:branched-subunit amino acid aminotransferase/4-amino-4-deoxychorismate lyase